MIGSRSVLIEPRSVALKDPTGDLYFFIFILLCSVFSYSEGLVGPTSDTCRSFSVKFYVLDC